MKNAKSKAGVPKTIASIVSKAKKKFPNIPKKELSVIIRNLHPEVFKKASGKTDPANKRQLDRCLREAFAREAAKPKPIDPIPMMLMTADPNKHYGGAPHFQNYNVTFLNQ